MIFYFLIFSSQYKNEYNINFQILTILVINSDKRLNIPIQ